MTTAGTYESFDVPLDLETVDLSGVLGSSYREVVTDGLPVVKPARSDVVAMLGGRRGAEVIAQLPPVMGECTHEALAAMAVLAGCPPRAFPVLVAAIRAAVQDPLNLLAAVTTTGNVAIAIFVSGPASADMGFHCGSNGLGPGPRANVTVGRALRLALMNIGGAVPGVLDVACLGWPGKLSFCAAEHTTGSPWPPFHADRGYAPDATVATVGAAYGFIEMADAASTSVEPLLANLSRMMAAARASGSRGHEVLVLLTPQHAHTFAAGGLDRRALQMRWHECLIGSAEHIDGATGRTVSTLTVPDDILVFVTGGHGGKSALVPLWSGSRTVSVIV